MDESSHGTLIVGPSWVGDMVLAQSLFKQLKRSAPAVSIDVLAPAWAVPLTERMPEVRRAVTMPVGHGELKLATRYQLGRSLRAQHYDRAIVLPNSLKSALIPFWANIPRRTGYRGEWRYGLLNDVRILDKQRLATTVSRFVALGLESGQPLPDPLHDPLLIPRLRIDEQKQRNALARLGIPMPTRPVLVLCPGAEYGPAKRWPSDYFAAVARRQHDLGWEVWLFGSDKDRAVTGAVKRAAGVPCLDLAGQTKLEDAVDLMSLAAAVVSNDSGLMHIAAALDRPLVAVYGSSDPGFTPPMSSRARVERLGLSCSPCFKRECPFGHYNCLVELKPDRVIAALNQLDVAA